MALITPAKSHPEVIVQAVAARDRKKAEAFAKANGIPQVLDSYQGTFIVFKTIDIANNFDSNPRRSKHRCCLHSSRQLISLRMGCQVNSCWQARSPREAVLLQLS